MTTHDPASIGATVRAILARVGPQGDVASIDDDTSLLESGALDSLTMVGLVAGIEERFAIVVDEAELVPEYFDSIAAIVALVSRKLGER